MKNNELKNAIAKYNNWKHMFEQFDSADLDGKNSVQDSIREEVNDRADAIAELLWDMFTDVYGLTEIQHTDYDKFDEIMEELEKSGTIAYIAATEESDVAFLNPMPVVFLQEVAKEVDMTIDTEKNVVYFN